MDSYISQGYKCYVKCNWSRPGFELVLSCPSPTTITITPWAPPICFSIKPFVFPMSFFGQHLNSLTLLQRCSWCILQPQPNEYQSYFPGFELVSLCPFPMTITITPRAPPGWRLMRATCFHMLYDEKKISIFMYIYYT